MPRSSAKNTATSKNPHDIRFGGRRQTPFCIIIKTTPSRPVDATCPDRHKHAAGAGAPRRFTAVGRASPFQKAGRSGKSPVPAFAVKIIKSPGMAAHDDEQQQQLPPPLHPSSWNLEALGWRTDRQKKEGGAGKPAEFQISRKGLASSPPFLQNSSPLPLAPQRSSWGKKGRHPDGRGLVSQSSSPHLSRH